MTTNKNKNRYCTYCGSNLERYYSVKGAAKLTGLSPEFYRKRIRERTITFVRIGNSVRIPASTIEKLIIVVPSISDEVRAILSNNT